MGSVRQDAALALADRNLAAPKSGFNTLAFTQHLRSPDPTRYQALQDLVKPHLDSFNSIFQDGLVPLALANIDPVVAVDSTGQKARIWIEDLEVAKPALSDREHHSINRSLRPSECRERGISYKGKITAKVCYIINDGPMLSETKQLGMMPIMVRSGKCNLHGLSPKQLVESHEDADEFGGYFIVNGIEKLVRLLIVARRNHALAISRDSMAKKGALYSRFATQIRSVASDQTSKTISLHYLTDGTIMLRFSHRKTEYFVSLVVVLRALVNASDRQIFDAIVQNKSGDSFTTSRVEVLLHEAKNLGLYTQQQCLEYLGSNFQIVFGNGVDSTDLEVARCLLSKVVLVHLSSNEDKFNMLVHMVRKLYAFVDGQVCADNPDSPMNQELLLDGHLYIGYLKEKLQEYLQSFKLQIQTEMRLKKHVVFTGEYMKRLFARVPSDIGRRLEYFLSTGNLVTQTGMDLQQVSGYTIVAEKLNYLRYLAHFRSVHRGAFFAELKTTTVRKLMPESWGFLCPVHTPDGAPCGLLNHLSQACQIVTEIVDAQNVLFVLLEFGMIPYSVGVVYREPLLEVFLDGRQVGLLPHAQAGDFVLNVRCAKNTRLPSQLECAHVPPSHGGQYPGIYLFSTVARFMRPVKNLYTNDIELIGSFEQVYMNIAVVPSEIKTEFSHVEIKPTNMLSVVANFTPFSDFNQSPRNMYQCQMAKQTMGTPCHAFPYRADNKLFRLQSGQTPIVRPTIYEKYGIDMYPNGTNAVVAVISYTGYDMEDAMIINKSAFERGFAHASIYKTEMIDLTEHTDRKLIFKASEHAIKAGLDADGLPIVGSFLRPGDALYCTFDEQTGRYNVQKQKAFEECYIESVTIIGDDVSSLPLQKVQIKFRIPRRPNIGDKFSSRHGQKGVCSIRYPTVDMPFTESGMTPDVIINPHAFPSRMTIGMLIESMAAKSGALHGLHVDATPFKFNEDFSAVDYFGEQLLKAGYNYYGNEPMYSGINGTELHCDIYIGVVYYQRLRHMVGDKFQVRSTGPIDNVTKQPIKGRKRRGGIRFGEMERDSLLAHGTSFLLKDRLMNCSDYAIHSICIECQSILPVYQMAGSEEGICKQCGKSDVRRVALPEVFKYLSAELMAMNIKLRVEV